MVWTGGATGWGGWGRWLGFSEEERRERKVEGKERREKRGVKQRIVGPVVPRGRHVNTTILLL